MSKEPLLEVSELTVAFRTGLTTKTTILKNASMKVLSGKIVSLVGENGSGKTTLFKTIFGLIPRFKGKISFNQEQTGYVPDKTQIPLFFTVKQALNFATAMFSLRNRNRTSRVQSVLELLELTEHQNKTIRSLSKGMQKRLLIAQGLLNDPSLLVMDEPFSGLDQPGRKALHNIFESFRKKGKSILYSTHEHEELCGHVLAIKNQALVKITFPTSS